MADDFVQRGKELLVKREFAEVVKVCRHGLLSRPALIDGRLLLGTALLALRRYDDVLAEMTIAQEIDRDHVLVYLLRGEALLRRGDAEEAVEVLARAVQLGRSNPVARKLYAEARTRAGLDEMPTPVEPPAAVAEPADEAEPEPAPAAVRRRPRWLVAALAALVVLAGAGLATFLIVHAVRSARARRSLLAQAERAAREQTYRSTLRATELLRRAVATGDAAAEAPLARLRAEMAFEHGVRLPGEDKVPGGREGQTIALYQELAAGTDPAEAARQAAALEAANPKDAELAYLSGRARMQVGDQRAAVSLRRSIALAPTPLAWIALGEVEAAGGHMDQALRAYDGALALVPGHPLAIVERARALAAAGRLPPADGREPEATLVRLAAGDGDPPSLAPREQLLARRALIEVKLARGDVAAALQLLARLPPEAAGDPRVRELDVEASLLSGDVAAARAAAERWRGADPASALPSAWLARVALAGDDLEAARAALADAGDGGGFAALVARAEIDLEADNLDRAGAGLERALALRPGDRTALLLRARLDLERGDAAAAEARLEPLYDPGHDPAVGTYLGEALRRRGERARARRLLEDAVLKLEAASGRRSMLAAAARSLALLDREEGRYADAAHEVERALGARPQDLAARELAAQLRFDLGDVAGARSDLDTLVVAEHSSPQVLILAARVHGETGDAAGARQLLAQASALPAAPSGEIIRERARLALADGHARQAATLLTANGRWPEDGDAWLILVEAMLATGDKEEISAVEPVVAEVARRFPGRAEESLAQGRLQLARDQAAEASRSFIVADQRLAAALAPPRARAEARVLAGRALEANGKAAEALADYREAAHLNPNSALARFHIGRLLAQRGDAGAAFDALSEAVKLQPTPAEAWFYLGATGATLKRVPAAREALTRYLKLAPHGPLAEQAEKLLAGL